MNTIEYLKKTYGYDTPIFLKDIRIGRKSKTAIKQDLYRAAKNGEIKRETNGVYYFPNPDSYFPDNGLGFDEIVHIKYVSDAYYVGETELEHYGYYSGMTFLNVIGISQQVPAVIEITTNNTSSKKREICFKKRRAILRKARIKVDSTNWRTLQFLDMFHWLNLNEVSYYKEKLVKYIDEYVGLDNIKAYLQFYGSDTFGKIQRLIKL